MSESKKIFLGFFVIIGLSYPIQAEERAQPAEFYVAVDGNDAGAGTARQPFAGLARAQQAVRQEIQKGLKNDIVVYLRGGLYFLEEPLRFGPEDSGTETYSITYAACPGEQVIFSGGRRIRGWQKGEGNRWRVELPEVKSGAWRFRQLFADGKRLTRARFPNLGEFLTIKAVDPEGRKFAVDQAMTVLRPEGQNTEAVFYRSWCLSIVQVEKIEGEEVITRNSPNSGEHPNKAKKGRKLFLENAREFLDQAGEWYLDAELGVLEYETGAGENPPVMEFIAPRLDSLLEIEGTAKQPVKNLHFAGLEFQHTDWELPPFGYRCIQAGQHGPDYQKQPSYALPAAVQWAYAEKCSLEKSRFAHFGAGGIGLGRGCRHNRILGCEFDDLGGSAVMAGRHPQEDEVRGQWLKNLSPDWTNLADAPFDNVINHNLIHHGGQIQKGAVGIWVAFSPGTRICHNLICHMPYTGISVGFIWSDIPTSQRENLVANNYIHHVMEEMNDGAAIYTLGYQPGTLIRNNLIHDVIRGRGLYTDEGSAQLVLENNICYYLGDYGYLHHYGHDNQLRNNIFAAAQKSFVNRFRGKEAASFTMLHNIFWTDRGGPPVCGVLADDGFTLDYNLYWDTRGGEMLFDGLEFSAWQKRGHDRHSQIADPRFADPEGGDFRLAGDSPAFGLGFQPINVSQIGPQGVYRQALEKRMEPFWICPMIRDPNQPNARP